MLINDNEVKKMKKILVIVAFTVSLGVNAFWNNNAPWNSGYGYYQDNGIFGFNPYDYWDPNWYAQEMDNMIDEFDNDGYNRYGYGYGPYRNYNRRHHGHMPWGGYGYNRNPYADFGHMSNMPWSNYGYNRPVPVPVKSDSKQINTK